MMKAIFFILLLISSKAGAIEGTVWYNAKGKVAWVDGPAVVKKAPTPFIPQWVAREERRDEALRCDYRPQSRSADAWPVWGYGHVFGYPSRYRHPGNCHSYPSSSFHITRPSGGVRVIIR